MLLRVEVIDDDAEPGAEEHQDGADDFPGEGDGLILEDVDDGDDRENQADGEENFSEHGLSGFVLNVHLPKNTKKSRKCKRISPELVPSSRYLPDTQPLDHPLVHSAVHQCGAITLCVRDLAQRRARGRGGDW